MRPLSKSKLMAYRQCPKRLWLEVHRPKLRENSASTKKEFAVGHEVGVHRLASSGEFMHHLFLNLFGKESFRSYAKALIATCGASLRV
jgi:hypothetical protein